MIASALPLAQLERFTISCTSALRFGVRWFGPWLSLEVHATGAHDCEAPVRARVEMLDDDVVNVAALSAAWPRITRLVASLCDSFASNWMYAPVIVAARGM